MFYVKRLIREHVELHQKDLLSTMMNEKDYEFVCKESFFLIIYYILTLIQCRLEQKVSKEFVNGFMGRFQFVNSIKITHFKIKLFYLKHNRTLANVYIMELHIKQNTHVCKKKKKKIQKNHNHCKKTFPCKYTNNSMIEKLPFPFKSAINAYCNLIKNYTSTTIICFHL